MSAGCAVDQELLDTIGAPAGALSIGLFTPNYPGVTGEGGIGTYTRHLAHGLVERGHRVRVITPAGSADEVLDAGVRVRLVRTGHFPLVDRVIPGFGACYRVARAVRRLAAEERFDVVEFPNWEGLGAFCCWSRRMPVVVRLHTSSLETQVIDGARPTRTARWDVRRERFLARNADALVTHSESHRSAMTAELGIDPAHIRVIPHGIEVQPEFRRDPRAGDEDTVVFLGRMEKRKGTVDLLRAVPDVLRKVPRTRFVFIGSDRPHCPGGRTHAQYVRDELPPEIGNRVSLLGRLPDADVDGWLQRADLFVAPSLYESFGLIFLEAMRWGTPVIGTTVGGIPEVVEDGKTGVLVPPSDPPALAAAIIRLLSNRPLRRELGEAGRRRVEQHFTTTRMAAQVEGLYRETITRFRTPSFGRPPGSSSGPSPQPARVECQSHP
jgi:glycogen(starch) synthase